MKSPALKICLRVESMKCRKVRVRFQKTLILFQLLPFVYTVGARARYRPYNQNKSPTVAINVVSKYLQALCLTVLELSRPLSFNFFGNRRILSESFKLLRTSGLQRKLNTFNIWRSVV